MKDTLFTGLAVGETDEVCSKCWLSKNSRDGISGESVLSSNSFAKACKSSTKVEAGALSSSPENDGTKLHSAI